jgi:catechol 2,3-dioxygenase-like lactoylglutathione lyase family enzyme
MTDSADRPALQWFMAEVRVSDRAGSVRWYRDMLGLTILLDDPARGFTLLGVDGGRIALKQGSASLDRAAVRLVFQVSDVDAVFERLGTLDIPCSGPTDSDEGYREIRLADPDGTPIHLFSWRGGPVAGPALSG